MYGLWIEVAVGRTWQRAIPECRFIFADSYNLLPELQLDFQSYMTHYYSIFPIVSHNLSLHIIHKYYWFIF